MFGTKSFKNCLASRCATFILFIISKYGDHKSKNSYQLFPFFMSFDISSVALRALKQKYWVYSTLGCFVYTRNLEKLVVYSGS